MTALQPTTISAVPEPTDGVGANTTPDSDATVQPPSSGCTLSDIARAKGLSSDFLRSEGWTDFYYLSAPAVRIPYRDAEGNETAVRFRIGLDHDGDCFRWKKRDRPSLYGLHKVEEYDRSTPIFIVEGETDTATMWTNGYQAVGVPGADTWKPEWEEHLKDFEIIYLVVEPDGGGTTLTRRIADGSLVDKVSLIEMGYPVGDDQFSAKDVTELRCLDPALFAERLDRLAMSGSRLCHALEQEADERGRAAWELCKDIAAKDDILTHLGEVIGQEVVGEQANVKLVYLAMTSRLFERPVSLVLKGPSSGGKSYLVHSVAQCFPDAAYLFLSAMTDKALAYFCEPLSHRHLIIQEASGLTGETGTYLVRTLLSEGRIEYATVDRVEDRNEGRIIRIEGPTGLILSTTEIKLHPENETRLLSLTVNDSPEQTRDIVRRIAEGRQPGDDALDYEKLRALQVWLESGEHRVSVPFAPDLAGLVDVSDTRMRRDFTMIMTLVRAHAVLHRSSRPRDGQGQIVATLGDYAAVRALIAPLLAQQVKASVSQAVRETVQAVMQAGNMGNTSVNAAEVSKVLGIGESQATRRARQAVELGYLKNLESRPNRPYQLEPGERMPDDREVLPTVEELEACMIARLTTGEGAPTPSTPVPSTDDEVPDPFEVVRQVVWS